MRRNPRFKRIYAEIKDLFRDERKLIRKNVRVLNIKIAWQVFETWSRVTDGQTRDPRTRPSVCISNSCCMKATIRCDCCYHTVCRGTLVDHEVSTTRIPFGKTRFIYWQKI